MLMKKNVNNEVRKDSATRVKSRKHLRVENKDAPENILRLFFSHSFFKASFFTPSQTLRCGTRGGGGVQI